MTILAPITIEEKEKRREILADYTSEKIIKRILDKKLVYLEGSGPTWAYIKALESFIERNEAIPCHTVATMHDFTITLSNGQEVELKPYLKELDPFPFAHRAEASEINL